MRSEPAHVSELLRQAAEALTPFPRFMGVSTLQAIEVEPRGGVGPGRGCVVVCPDGLLHEYELRYGEGQGLFAIDPDLREALTPCHPHDPGDAGLHPGRHPGHRRAAAVKGAL